MKDLVQLISRRVGRCLARQGLLDQDVESVQLDLDPAEDTDVMPQILGRSIAYRIAVGPQEDARRSEFAPSGHQTGLISGWSECPKANGFSLHAGVSCEGHQKEIRDRLRRYIARPAVLIVHFPLRSSGKVVYILKTPHWNGTTQIAFNSGDFIAR